MDAIVKLLTDPAAWFNGIFFWAITVLIQKIFQRLPSGIRGYTRKAQLKRTQKIAKERRSEFLVFSAISRANANYMLFMILTFGYLFGILFSPMLQVVHAALLLGALLGLPVLGFEVAWLRSDQYAKDLINARARLTRR